MEDTKQQKITTPMAIVIAGVLIMVGILLTNGGGNKVAKEKTLSEQVGVSKEKFTQCMNETNLQTLSETTNANAEKAMKGVPANERGTPYSVIVGKNGSKAEIRGAYPKEAVLKLITEVTDGKVTTPYTGEIVGYQEGDHILGNKDAPILIVEYSDLECPYCKKFSGTMKEIVAESNGNVAWVYRHWVVHQGALPKAAAAECVAKLKGNDAFWQYVDLVFGLMKTEEDTSNTDQL
ncbi:MAG: thioredoxin domain-containing protein [Candidatus Paceibacterota bacterium]